MSQNLDRARKTGSFTHRVQKYMKLDVACQDQSETDRSELVPPSDSSVFASFASHTLTEDHHTMEDAALEEEQIGSLEENTGSGSAEPEIVDYLGEDSLSDQSAEEPESVCPMDSMSIENSIKFWALATNASHKSINMILKIFKRTGTKLPATANTLLNTKRNTSAEIVGIRGGQFWYRSINKCLLTHFRYTKSPLSQLSITVSIDGLPLHKSSGTQFWPILFTIFEIPDAPVMTAAIFCGTKKPESIEEFLRPMVDEINSLTSYGLTIHGQRVNIKLRAIVADTPARSFIKGVVGHTGYEGCLKCTVVGKHHSVGRTMTFPGLHAPKRTHEGFRTAAYPGHSKIRTPLMDLLQFDIVEDVVVADRLHLIDLGVMKRLLMGWRDGKLGKQRWLKATREQVESAIKIIKLPTEIHRKLRDIEYAHQWKGSEYASFLHYAGIVVLKDNIPEDAYKHFLLLFCGVTLLSSNVYRGKWPLAGKLLDKFVEGYDEIYGERYIGSNVHNVQHMYEEVKRFGPLPGISTYPFENHLQQIKRSLRSKWQNLQQAINRISEFDAMRMPRTTRKSRYPFLHKRGSRVTVYVRSAFQLQNAPKDCWFLTKDHFILQFVNGLMSDAGSLVLTARMLENKESLFEEPYKSCEMYVYKGLTNSVSEYLVETHLDFIKCKLVAVPTGREEELVFIPLLHTLIE